MPALETATGSITTCDSNTVVFESAEQFELYVDELFFRISGTIADTKNTIMTSHDCVMMVIKQYFESCEEKIVNYLEEILFDISQTSSISDAWIIFVRENANSTVNFLKKVNQFENDIDNVVDCILDSDVENCQKTMEILISKLIQFQIESQNIFCRINDDYNKVLCDVSKRIVAEYIAKDEE